MTEEQAKVKWCPFARVSLPGNASGNRISTFHKSMAQREAEHGSNRDLQHYAQQEADCNCIGSRCMAWRVDPTNSETGYCGLAGAPPL